MGLQRRGIVFETRGRLLVSVQYQAVIVGGGNSRWDVNQCRAHPESTVSLTCVSLSSSALFAQTSCKRTVHIVLMWQGDHISSRVYHSRREEIPRAFQGKVCSALEESINS